MYRFRLKADPTPMTAASRSPTQKKVSRERDVAAARHVSWNNLQETPGRLPWNADCLLSRGAASVRRMASSATPPPAWAADGSPHCPAASRCPPAARGGFFPNRPRPARLPPC